MLKNLRLAIVLVALAMFSVFISACGGNGDTGSGGSTPAATSAPKQPVCVSGNITFDGSTALYPLANDVANKYQDACNGATITAKQSGSGTGMSGAANGTIQIGNSDVFADPAKTPGLVDHQVAVVVFSVILNADVTGVTNLTSQQITDIYTGKITNWKDVGGNDKQIVTVSRTPGSGTRVTFDQYVLQGGATEAGGSSNVTANTSGDVASTVKSTSGSIAYVATSYAKKNNLQTIKIDGFDDSDANVKTNTYKFWNVEHMYTKGEATGLAKAFIDYMASNASEVQALRVQDGFIALSDMQQSALAAKQKNS
jgi:phosphate transport system substrate-binding protein